MNAAAAAGFGVAFCLLLFLYVKWKWRAEKEVGCPPCTPVQLVHHMCPHNNVVQSYQVEEKDSLDEQLDVLTRKLAEKEGRLRLSKFKIRERQHEMENLHTIDHEVRTEYRQIMDTLRSDLMENEGECKKLQDQIEWASRRRAELTDEVRRGKILYEEAAVELASNLTELQRGRERRVTEKPLAQHSITSLRLRKEPRLPRSSVGSIVIKSPPSTPSDFFPSATNLGS